MHQAILVLQQCGSTHRMLISVSVSLRHIFCPACSGNEFRETRNPKVCKGEFGADRPDFRGRKPRGKGLATMKTYKKSEERKRNKNDFLDEVEAVDDGVKYVTDANQKLAAVRAEILSNTTRGVRALSSECHGLPRNPEVGEGGRTSVQSARHEQLMQDLPPANILFGVHMVSETWLTRILDSERNALQKHPTIRMASRREAPSFSPPDFGHIQGPSES